MKLKHYLKYYALTDVVVLLFLVGLIFLPKYVFAEIIIGGPNLYCDQQIH